MPKNLTGQAQTGARYIGNGSDFYQGIPARDLTPEEWADIYPAIQEVVLAAGLYSTDPAPTDQAPSDPAPTDQAADEPQLEN